MVTDSILAGSLSGLAPNGASSGPSTQSIERFQQAYERASASPDGAVASVLNPLFGLNEDSTRLAQQADLISAQQELRPSDLMMLSMRSHEFLFHCQLVANVANRSADGVQQLFRQQS